MDVLVLKIVISIVVRPSVISLSCLDQHFFKAKNKSWPIVHKIWCKKHLKFLFRLDKLNLQHVQRLFGTKFDIQVNTVLMVYYHDYGNPHDKN